MSDHLTRTDVLAAVRRVVVKLGSSVVTSDDGLDMVTIADLVEGICRLKAQGKEFIVVSSGAVAAGVRQISLKEGARTIPQKQAAAAVGQGRLMVAYEEAFGRHGIHVAQLLLTKDDFSHRTRYLNARNTLMTLLSWGVVPIINENDTVVVDEIKLGDNDNLSALVATLADADLLLTLTDMEGLMDCDPRNNPDACLVPLVEDITPEVRNLVGGSTSRAGRGGMASKLEAAAKVRMSGIPMIIVKGKTPEIIPRTLLGDPCGTLILPAKERLSARKHWIHYILEPEGTLVVDAGAAAAVAAQGKSLLPIGVIEVVGTFDDGAKVLIVSPDGRAIAAGLSNYSADEIDKIKGRQTVEIDWILGYRRNDEVIHVDNLVVMDEPTP